jgi:hypothetical protein
VCLLLQTQQRRIRELEHEVLATRKEVEKKDDQLRAEVTKTDALQKRNEELQQELDNNTGTGCVLTAPALAPLLQQLTCAGLVQSCSRCITRS